MSIVAVLYDYFKGDSDDSDQLDLLATLFTFLTMGTIIFEKLSVIEWIKEKKDYERKPSHEVVFMIMEIVLLIPTPNIFYTTQVAVTDIYGAEITIGLEELLAAYVSLRSLYFMKFLIHFELYYGSRPDRLSRLYTVKFGTFNAFKFLINEKPQIILLVIFILNYLLLPLVLLLVEG